MPFPLPDPVRALSRFALLTIFAVALLPARAWPQAATPPAAVAAGFELVSSAEGITEYRLIANNLHVLLFPDASKQTTTVNVTYLVGSRHENYGETGMAHLLEHLLFKGSVKFPKPEEDFAKRGAHWNGSTWLDRTNYFETVPASPENLRWALEFEADRMVNSRVSRADLDSEMTVVRNEFERGENSPNRVLFERVQAAAFAWHSYGKSTIGNRSDIENVSIDRLQAFYRMYYQPDNAVLLIAGRFDGAAALKHVAEFFGAIPRPSRVLPKLYTVEPVQDGERSVTVRRVGDNQLVQLAYRIPSAVHPDADALEVLSSVLGDTPGGRMHRALVETGKAVGVAAWTEASFDPNLLSFFAVLRKDEKIDVVRDQMIREADAIAADGAAPSKLEAEVERVKTKLLKQFELSVAQSDSFAVALSEAIAVGDWRLYFLGRDRVRGVTADDVRRVAKAYLKPDNRTVGLFIPTAEPDRASIPQRPDLAAVLKDFKGNAPPTEGEAFEPSYANIGARTTRAVLGNGLKLALLPKKTRGNTVSAQFVLHYGDEAGLTGRTTLESLAGSMLMRGTSKHSRDEIQQEFERFQANVSVRGGTTTLQTTRENLPAVLKLVAEILREPAFPESEFEQLKRSSLASIENQRSEPEARAGNALARHLSPYPRDNIRYVKTFEERLAEIQPLSVAGAKQVYTDLYGASGAELAVVGDFDAAATRALAEELFGSWKNPRPYARIVSKFKPVPPSVQTIETPDKANAVIVAALSLELSENDADYPALTLANYIFGASSDSRLFRRIRDKDGLSYGVGSSLTASFFDRAGRFSFNAIAAPQNAARVEAAFREELAKAVKDGFTAEEIANAKSGLLKTREVSRTSDGNLAYILATLMHQNIWMDNRIEFERRISALTMEEIGAAFRRHIKPEKISVVKAGDFRKAAAN